MKMTLTIEVTTYKPLLVTQSAREGWEYIVRKRIYDTLLRELGYGTKVMKTEIEYEEGEVPDG